MAKIGRPGLPSDKRQQVWELRKQGKSTSEIARTIGAPPGSIFSIFLPFGGYYQAPQRRRTTALTLAEREEISQGLAAQESYRAIGRRLGRPASTIAREIGRNRAPVGTGPSMRMTERGAAPDGRSRVISRRTRPCATTWRPDSRRTGRQSRSLACSRSSIRKTKPCGSRTKRSTNLCS